jgi:c-di-GMP-binding flagellar brake protein YcgR
MHPAYPSLTTFDKELRSGEDGFVIDEYKYPERRRYDRASIRVGVRVKTETGYKHFSSDNLSAGGVFLLSKEPAEEESELEMELFIPSVSLPIKAKGEVVWNQRQEPAGFAVRFTEIAENSRRLIGWVVKRYLAKQDLQESIERAYELSKSF